MSSQNIEIYIDNYKVDFDGLSSVQLKKQFVNIKEFSKRKTSFSKPITVIYTPNNALLLGAAFNINEVGGWDRNSRPAARIVTNGTTTLEGLAKLDTFGDSYSFVIYQETVNIDALLSTELITGNADSSLDISFTNQYSFNFTRQNLRTKMLFAPVLDGTGINYAYGDLVGSDDISDYENDRLFIPSIAAKELLEEIMLSIGKTITFSPVITTYINKMYIPFNGEYTDLTNEWKYEKREITDLSFDFNIGAGTENRYIGGLNTVYNKITDLGATTGTANSVEIGNNYGEYKVEFTLRLKKKAIPIVEGSAEINPNVFIKTDGSFEEVDIYNTTTGDEDDYDNPIIVESSDDYVEATFEAYFTAAGGSVSVYLGVPESEIEGAGFVILNDNTGGSFVEMTKLDSYYNEDSPNVIASDKILPVDYMKKSLFNDIVTIFNAVTQVDGDNLYLQTAEEYSSSSTRKVIDWSEANKIDESTIEMGTLLSQTAEINQFQYGTSDDKYNADFQDQYDYNIADLLRTSDTKTVNTKSIVSSNTLRVNNYVSLINTDEYNTALTPRILFINDVSLGSMYFGLDTEGTRSTFIRNLPILSNRFDNDPTATDNLILAFTNKFTYSDDVSLDSDTNATIHNKFYSKDEAIMTGDDLILLTADFSITSEDFSDINFNDLVFIRTSRNGDSYYRLNEIPKYIINQTDATEIEFLQVDLDVLNADDFEGSEIDLTLVSLSV